MQAVKGVYDNGSLTLRKRAPVNKSEVIVIFTDNENDRGAVMSDDEAMRIYNKFTRSIKHEINEKEELMEALDEKYGGAY